MDVRKWVLTVGTFLSFSLEFQHPLRRQELLPTLPRNTHTLAPASAATYNPRFVWLKTRQQFQC